MSLPVPAPIVAARRFAGLIFILGLVVVLIGIALVVNWYVTRPVDIAAPPTARFGGGSSGTGGSNGPASSSPRATPKPIKPPKTKTKTKTELEREARAELERLAATDLAETNISGQWVAQVSSKYYGVDDDHQKTGSGSHIFEGVDILAEHRALRKKYSRQHEVRLLRGEDFYPYTTYKGKTFWYTIVMDDFGSEQDVERFCGASYSHLSGKARENPCLPRELGN